MSIKRVAFLLNFIPPYRIPLFQALKERLADFRIFISTDMEKNRSWKSNWEDLPVTIQHTLTIQRNWRHPYGFSEPIFIHIPYDTLLHLKNYRPDVVISSEFGLRTAQAVLYRKTHPKSRLVVWATLSEHLEQGRGKLRYFLRKLILPCVDAVIVNGESGYRYIKQFGYPGEKIFRVPQTIDIKRFATIPLEKSDLEASRLLYAGRLIELKGLQLFIPQLARWAIAHPDRNIEFNLAGDGPHRTELETIDLPVNIQLKFLGDIPYADIEKIYSEAGIFVLPTLADEWGLVVNEALASGLPVLGSLYSQSVEELVEEGKTGWLFHPKDPDEVYAAIDRALQTSPEELKFMRISCRQRGIELTPETMADRIYRVSDRSNFGIF